MNKLSSYKNLIFDCDGVILNSNKIKTKAFKDVVSCYGDQAAEDLKNYHLMNGGISRYAKFNYFLNAIAPNYNIDQKSIKLDVLISNYSKIVKNELENCEICSQIINYRKKSNAIWFVVSGSDQEELIKIFTKRKLVNIFDGGIFGSPLTKDQIFKNIFNNNHFDRSDSIYIGDSKYDYESAKHIGIDFVFISKWSQFKGIRNFAAQNNINFCDEFKNLI
tara:strand:+ start:213 stop:872 length:660 start_codon:yes stop_codon:yes gene_type:complete